MTQTVVVSTGAVSAIALGALVFLGVQGRPTQPTSRALRDDPIAATIQSDSVVTAAPTAVTVTPSAASATEPRLNESALLEQLRELAASDPPLSLRLARDALARSPNSPNAPEFEWHVVKALFNLHRIDEAKQEARSMLYRYPGNSFSADVEHHLLNHPPNPQDLPQ
jgi:hypothetical protein